MSKISKAVAATFGAVAAWLAVMGLGDGGTVFGIPQEAAMGVLVPVVSFIATYIAPKNSE